MLNEKKSIVDKYKLKFQLFEKLPENILKLSNKVVGEKKLKIFLKKKYNENLINYFGSLMYCKDAPDILIRTSGETRLSDFLTLQVNYTKDFSRDFFLSKNKF
jgi:undecaprenyl diphosphate synthase